MDGVGAPIVSYIIFVVVFLIFAIYSEPKM